MSDVTTNSGVVNSGVQEQVAQAAQLSAEQQADILAEAKKELGLVVKALRSGNRENIVSQYLAGLHGLRFINLCRKGGKARAFATGELERDLSWWLGKNVDANLILRTYAAINLLHGDIMPPPSGAKAAERNAWAEMVDRLPPVGHFHKAWSQLVERVDDGTEERWVLLPGFEERCMALYQDVQSKGIKLEDETDAGTVVEKGVLTLSREFMIEFMRYKADKKAAEAAAKSEVKEELEEQAKDFEDKAQEQQRVVKSLLEQSQQPSRRTRPSWSRKPATQPRCWKSTARTCANSWTKPPRSPRKPRSRSRRRWSRRRKPTRARRSWRSAATAPSRTMARTCRGKLWERTRRRRRRPRTWRRRCTASWPSMPSPRTCCTPCSTCTVRIRRTLSNRRCKHSG
jgi:hypothetical protein